MNIFTSENRYRLTRYDLSNESIAVAACGMRSATELDRRCIMFTIHIESRKDHEPLCRAMFEISENYFKERKFPLRSATHCGLASFLDINGSKFSGADRDATKVHCHGLVFFPHQATDEHAQQLICELQAAATGRNLNAPGYAKVGPNSAFISRFRRNSHQACLSDWISYAQKEETRLDAEGAIGFFLPFDDRQLLPQQKAEHVEQKSRRILSKLRSSESFKIFRKPKQQSE